MANPRAILVPMTEVEYPAFLAAAIPGYAQANVEAGYWREDDALEKSRQAHDDLLPDGLATSGHHLYRACDAESGEDVGWLWIAMREQTVGWRAFVYSVEVLERLRGHGYGRAVMEACAEQARELGASSVGLHVFAQNTPAFRLYQSLGYEATSLNMVLPL
jgi:ribosomal protein S18 acetylase RimI-like enzyme